jgi:hypothetical protein
MQTRRYVWVPLLTLLVFSPGACVPATPPPSESGAAVEEAPTDETLTIAL